jgi:prevent-host-death family protein
MEDSIAVSDARGSLPELLDRVAAGEEITLTRHGRPVAVLVRPDRLRARRADDALAAAGEIAALLDVGRQDRLDHGRPLTAARADELAAQVRSGRRAR